jgi:DNA polymerase-4
MTIRKIIHLDLDAFFCAVEELRDPSLRGKPFAVGGSPDSRGVVASCSYPARKQGVHSAMPMSVAVRTCPALLIVPARHRDYAAHSRQVMKRLHALTPLVEQISIDEAFLDVTDLEEKASTLARRLQQIIFSELGLPCSLGVATNKLVAKIANNVGKASALRREGHEGAPNALQVVLPGQEAAFLAPLAAGELWGVGPKTALRLAELGMHTIGDIARFPEKELVARFGKIGAELALRSRGIDTRPLVTEHERKSISEETTFVRDVSDGEHLRGTLREQSERVAASLKAAGLTGACVKLKLRWSDFTTLTRQTTLAGGTDDPALIFSTVEQLLGREWSGRPVRLIGVGVSALSNEVRQMGLFDAPDERADRLFATMQKLRRRFEDAAVRKASEMGKGEAEE